MFSNRGDPIGAHVQRVLRPGNATLRLSHLGEQFGVSVVPGGIGLGFRFNFSAAPGETLAVGEYPDVADAFTTHPGRPTMDITNYATGCDWRRRGSFEIKQLDVEPDGTVTRLWLSYEQRCEDSSRTALFGEIRYAMPDQAGDGETLSSVVRWPQMEVGDTGTSVPVTFLAHADTSLGTISVAGADADAFAVLEDDCSGASLTAGDSCAVWVKPHQPHQPQHAGSATATMAVPDGSGATHDVALEVQVNDTYTALEGFSEPGDWVASGQGAFSLADPEFGFEPTGGESWVQVVPYLDGTVPLWHASFEVPQGQTLSVGRYDVDAPLDSFLPPTGPVMEVFGDNGCSSITGHFTVHQLERDKWGGVAALDVTFEQHCDGAAPALRGSVRYHAGDRAPRDLSVSEPAPPAPPAITPAVPAPSPGPGEPGQSAPPGLGPPATAPVGRFRVGLARVELGVRTPAAQRIGRRVLVKPRARVSCPAKSAGCTATVVIRNRADGSIVAIAAVRVAAGSSSFPTAYLNRGARDALLAGGAVRSSITVAIGEPSEGIRVIRKQRAATLELPERDA